MFCCSSAALSATCYFLFYFFCYVLHKLIRSKAECNSPRLLFRSHRTRSFNTYAEWNEGACMPWALAVKTQYTQSCRRECPPALQIEIKHESRTKLLNIHFLYRIQSVSSRYTDYKGAKDKLRTTKAKIPIGPAPTVFCAFVKRGQQSNSSALPML